jgi:O-antigen/teichoic acid export membrane protein
MFNKLKNIDTFTKNIIIVFLGTSFANFFSLLYQLLIAHKLSAPDFAAFNSLLSIFILISSPLDTLRVALAKYCAEFSAKNEIAKLRFLLSDLFKKISFFTLLTFFIFWSVSNYIIKALKISSFASGTILAALVALAWFNPLFSGGIQGLELFGWFTSAALIGGVLKLALAFIFILLGFNIAGALGALLSSSVLVLLILCFPLKQFFSVNTVKEKAKEYIRYNEILSFLFPAALSTFCFMALVNLDMLLVKYFFSQQDSGLYSLAQMLGKIFLFLPATISIVMFPKTSGLNAKDMDTTSTFKRSLFYVFVLCALAVSFYNLFPTLVFRVLTGKVYFESIFLGRLFSISMSFFTFLYLFISYFLSIKDLRFIKYLTIFTILEFIAIVLFHKNLVQVQLVLCINAVLLFLIHLFLAYKKQ